MLRCLYVVAEAQLGHTLRQAVRLLADADTSLPVTLPRVYDGRTYPDRSRGAS